MTPAELQALIEESERRETRRIATVLAIIELRSYGMSLRSIGTCLGVSHEYVRQICLSISHDSEGVA